MEDLLAFSESDIKLRFLSTFSRRIDSRPLPFHIANSTIWSDPTVTALKLSPLYKSKFMTAWRKLKPNAPPSNTAPHQTIRHIVISAKEQEAMSKLQKAGSDVDQLLESNAAIQAELTADSQRISGQIDSIFSEYITRLTQRAEELKIKLNTESKAKLDALSQQQEQLSKTKESVTSGLEQENALLLDTNVDSKKREIKIESITDDILSTMNDSPLKVSKLVLAKDNQSVFEVTYISILSKCYFNVF